MASVTKENHMETALGVTVAIVAIALAVAATFLFLTFPLKWAFDLTWGQCLAIFWAILASTCFVGWLQND